MTSAARATITLVALCGAILIPAKAQQHVISTYAGGVPLPQALPDWDVSIATDSDGNAYFTSRYSVFKRTAAITGDRAGNSYVADPINNAVRILRPGPMK